MKDFLLEIYTEEIPAKVINPTVKQISECAINQIKNYNLLMGTVKSFGTPRRLVLFIDNVEEKETDSILEVKGPSIRFAYDANGNKSDALLKFLETNKIKEEDILVKEVKGNKYIFGKKRIQGRQSKEILKEISINLINSLNFPRTMRWNETNVRFIRPIRNILAMIGDEIIDFEYAGIKSNNKTYGFFFDSPLEIYVKNPQDYFIKIKEKYIILDFNERKRIVEKRIEELSIKINGKPIYDNEFLEEIINLTEFPTPFICSFDDAKVKIPDCIIESVVKDHMKSIPLSKKDGKGLIPYFIAVKNGTSDFLENTRKGYEKVVKARLLDGEFFYNEDIKRKLEDRLQELSDVIFMKKLGSLKDKVERVKKLSKLISEKLDLNEKEKNELARAVILSKCDLVTNVVREFQELQGTIGGIYATIQGEPATIANAISEQYLPRFSNDKIPESKLGKILSIIDRVDTVVGSMLASLEYTSSKDPYGIRRAVSGIIEIISQYDSVTFPITSLIEKAGEIYKETISELTGDINNVFKLLKERINFFFKDLGFEYDLVNSLHVLSIDELPTFKERLTVIKKHKQDEDFKILCQSNKRIKNILAKAEFPKADVDEKYLFDLVEIKLNEMVNESKTLVESLISNKDFEAVLKMLYLFNPVISNFFDKILIMDENEKIRYNRLNLLLSLKTLFDRFVSFSEIILSE